MKHHPVIILASIAFSIVLAGFLWALVSLPGMARGPIILHFDGSRGITQIGTLENIIAIGAFGLLVIVTNFAIALEFDARDRFLGKFLAATTFVFAVLLFIVFAAIINVNT